MNYLVHNYELSGSHKIVASHFQQHETSDDSCCVASEEILTKYI